MTTISNLFASEPAQWGLRGDPFLWEEMKTKLEPISLPETHAELERILHSAFVVLTGHTWDNCDAIPVDRYDRRGMSGRMVCPEFWKVTALPLIMSRYSEVKEGRE